MKRNDFGTFDDMVENYLIDECNFIIDSTQEMYDILKSKIKSHEYLSEKYVYSKQNDEHIKIVDKTEKDYLNKQVKKIKDLGVPTNIVNKILQSRLSLKKKYINWYSKKIDGIIGDEK